MALSKKAKQEVIRLTEIVLIVENIVLLKGFQSLTMQEIVDRVSISRATLFKTITNIETGVGYLAIDGLEFWLRLLDRSYAFECTCKERLRVFDITFHLFKQIVPHKYQAFHLVSSEVYRTRIDAKVLKRLDELFHQIISKFDSVITKAIMDEKSLRSDLHISSESIALALWELMFSSPAFALDMTMESYKRDYHNGNIRLLAESMLLAVGWIDTEGERTRETLKEELSKTIFKSEFKLVEDLLKR